MNDEGNLNEMTTSPKEQEQRFKTQIDGHRMPPNLSKNVNNSFLAASAGDQTTAINSAASL